MGMGRGRTARGRVVLLGTMLLMLSGFISPAGVVHGAVYSGIGTLEAERGTAVNVMKAGQAGTVHKENKENKGQWSQPATADPVPQIISRVSPSVVGIIGKAGGETGGPDDRYNLTHGSGIIIRADGWIITNAHVMAGLEKAVVVTSDGTSYNITDTYSDEFSDLALVKIKAKALKPATFAGNSANLQVGEKVIAIGTPISFSLRNSATVGVISGLNRSVDAAYRLIQSDTAINPGNSGGPLVNMKGRYSGSTV